MTEHDKNIYKSITKKIINRRRHDITDDEVEWLKKHPDILLITKKMVAKVEILSYHESCKDTMEEILFILDLSDSFIR